jgi:hypothetical protein
MSRPDVDEAQHGAARGDEAGRAGEIGRVDLQVGVGVEVDGEGFGDVGEGD